MNAAIYLFTIALAGVLIGLVSVGLLPDARTQLLLLAGLAGVGTLVAFRVLAMPLVDLLLLFLLTPLYRIRARGPGAGHLPLEGPLLVVANHSSYLDPFWLGKVLPRRFTPMMTSVFYDRPVVRWLMAHAVGAIRVQVGQLRREAPELRQAVEKLRQGSCVLIFPEGILRRTQEQLLRGFGQGVWHILREVPETPVVVCWIEGGWGSMGSYQGGPPFRNKRLDWRRPIDVAIEVPSSVPAEVLADHRTTRRYLARTCLECRRYLGLEVPPPGEPGVAPADEEQP